MEHQVRIELTNNGLPAELNNNKLKNTTPDALCFI